MKILPLRLSGTWAVHFDAEQDERGYFCRVFDRRVFASHGLVTDWNQMSQSHSLKRNTIRGLHFQAPPFGETKIVRVIRGAIMDVFVDLRRGSPTYGEWDSLELTDANWTAIYLSVGFAHGFCTLSDHTTVLYSIDSAYVGASQGGIAWNDPMLAIPWPATDVVLSARDRQLPPLARLDTPFN